jgi:hypothetical protein
MKTISKAALASLMVAGAAVATAAPAEARIGVSINLGLFAPAVPVAPAPVYVLPSYCYGSTYYANCGYRVYGEPVFWNGYWYPNPSYRIVGGRREFWIHGGWHEARLREHFRRR